MLKKNWFTIAIICICGAAVLAAFSIIFKSQTGVDLPWWAYIVALFIFALLVYLVYLLIGNRTERFDKQLAGEKFNVDKRYDWLDQSLCLDFTSKCVANTYLSTKPFFPFSDVAGYRYETYQNNKDVELPDDKRYVSLVITVKKEGFEYEYMYIPVFEVVVDNDCIGDNFEITDELLEKYPELKQVAKLQNDLDAIEQINQADGIRSNVRKN